MAEIILTGDALEQLRHLPPESVHTCVTSPPYYNLRDYGAAGQIGNEASVEISIHAPHAGRDLEAFTFRHGQLAFQSTRPMRGAT